MIKFGGWSRVEILQGPNAGWIGKLIESNESQDYHLVEFSTESGQIQEWFADKYVLIVKGN